MPYAIAIQIPKRTAADLYRELMDMDFQDYREFYREDLQFLDFMIRIHGYEKAKRLLSM